MLGVKKVHAFAACTFCLINNMDKKTTTEAPTALFKLDETLIELRALLDISLQLHHYATLPDGWKLTDATLTGLLAWQARLNAEMTTNLEGTFACVRKLNPT